MNFVKKNGTLFLLLFVIGDFSIPYLLSFFYPHYQPFHQVISDLGEVGSPVRGAFRWSSVITGTFLLLALPGISRYYFSVSRKLTDFLLLALASFAIGQCILTGLFSVNRGNEAVNFSMIIHQLGSGLGTIGMLIVPFLLASLSWKEKLKKRRNIYFFLFFCSILFSCINGLSQLFDFPLQGLWQRVSMLFMYLPVLSLAFNLKHRQRVKE